MDLNAWAALLEEALQRVLELDPETAERLAGLDGRTLGLELVGDGEPFRLYVLPRAGRLRFARHVSGEADVTIAGPPSIFLRQWLRRAPVVSGELKIRGDIELGQRFQRLLTGIDIDWEEGLSRLVGDVPARRLGQALQDLAAFGRHMTTTLQMDTAEYLQEEVRLLARREQVDAFLEDVDRLRMDADRLDKRIERLIDRRP